MCGSCIRGRTLMEKLNDSKLCGDGFSANWLSEPRGFQCCRGACLATSRAFLFCSGKDSPLCRVAWGRSSSTSVNTAALWFASKNAECAFLLHNAADSFSNLLFKRIPHICWRSILRRSDPSVLPFGSISIHWQYNPIKRSQRCKGTLNIPNYLFISSST